MQLVAATRAVRSRQTRVVAAACLVFAAPLSAGVIVLQNGDRITGDIKSIYNGDILIEPEYSDEFSVDQDKIAYIESKKRFDLEFRGEDMIKRTAIFRGADAQGRQIVELDGREMTISIMEIGELQEEEEFFDWRVAADISIDFNRGNTDSTEVAVITDWYAKYGRQKHYVDTLWVNEKQKDPSTNENITTEDRQRYRYNLNYELSDPWFAGTFGSYETDDIAGINYRYTIAPTIGYKIWDNVEKLLNFQLGYGYQNEQIIDDSGLRNNQDGGIVVAVIRFDYDLGRPDLRFYAKNATVQTRFGEDNLINQLDAGLAYEITDLLYLKLETSYDYESKPAEGADKEDVMILVGFGVEFEK
jgi:putative salt-induced outer membrane protein YdiY